MFVAVTLRSHYRIRGKEKDVHTGRRGAAPLPSTFYGHQTERLPIIVVRTTSSVFMYTGLITSIVTVLSRLLALLATSQTVREMWTGPRHPWTLQEI
jgi:hypothetical protein